MTKRWRIILGSLTLWPLFYLSLYFGIFLINFQPVISASSLTNPSLGLRLVFGLHYLTVLLLIGLLGFYVRHLLINEQIPRSRKPLSTVIIVLFSIVAMPVYWFFYIWRTPPDLVAPQQSKPAGAPVVFTPNAADHQAEQMQSETLIFPTTPKETHTIHVEDDPSDKFQAAPPVRL